MPLCVNACYMTAHHRCDGIEVGITEEVQDIKIEVVSLSQCMSSMSISNKEGCSPCFR